MSQRPSGGLLTILREFEERETTRVDLLQNTIDAHRSSTGDPGGSIAPGVRVEEQASRAFGHRAFCLSAMRSGGEAN